MRLSSTSTQRTYRYVRLALVGAVLVLAVSVVVVTIVDGPITSISALFYTPGRTLFTGALCAIALALVALSGHSVEQVLLDVAALFPPIIAVVPTPIGRGDVAGLVPACADGGMCVPAAELPGVTVGVMTLVVVGAVAVIAAFVLARTQRTLTGGTATGLACAAAVVVGMPVWLAVWPRSLLSVGHLVATGVFFGLMIAVAVVSAVTARGRLRTAYVVVAVGMAASLGYLTIVFVLRLSSDTASARVPWVLIGEAVLVSLFCVLWVAQTVQKWNEVNPAVSRSGIPQPPVR